MQTFLSSSNSFQETAHHLDNKRLHKQTLEGWQLLLALTKLNPQGEHRDPKGWANHPAANMWRGHETALVSYLMATYDEWKSRGFKSTMKEKIYATYELGVSMNRISDKFILPTWIEDKPKFDQLASTHRVALLWKDYDWYSQFNWQEDTGTRPEYYQYLWPDANGELYLGTYNAA